jgi:hypothetical protein
MWVNSESISNQTNESEVHNEKYDKQQTWTWRGIAAEVIRMFANARPPNYVVLSAGASEGQKTDEEMMMWTPEFQLPPKPVTDPPEAQTRRPRRPNRDRHPDKLQQIVLRVQTKFACRDWSDDILIVAN